MFLKVSAKILGASFCASETMIVFGYIWISLISRISSAIAHLLKIFTGSAMNFWLSTMSSLMKPTNGASSCARS